MKKKLFTALFGVIGGVALVAWRDCYGKRNYGTGRG